VLPPLDHEDEEEADEGGTEITDNVGEMGLVAPKWAGMDIILSGMGLGGIGDGSCHLCVYNVSQVGEK